MDAPTDLGLRPARPARPAPRGPPGPRRLRRRPDDGHIAGVCAGVAEYFNVDPVIVRIAAVVLLFSGPGAFAYVLAWIFVPAEPTGPPATAAPSRRSTARTGPPRSSASCCSCLGVSVIWGDWWSPARDWLFPLGLMALGAWLLLRRDDDADETAGRSRPPRRPRRCHPPRRGRGAPASRPTSPRPTTAADGRRRRRPTAPADATSTDATRTLDDDHRPAHHRAGDGGAGGAPPPTAPVGRPAVARPRRRSPRPARPPLTADRRSPATHRRPERVRRAARSGPASPGSPASASTTGPGRRPGDPRPGLRARVLRRRQPGADLPGAVRGRRARRSPPSSTSRSRVPSASSTGRRPRARATWRTATR